MADLKRHLVCVDRTTGKIRWTKHFDPVLPEHKYVGEGSYHGYSSSTPTSDGERLYVFFGKSGVFCFDLDGNEQWHTSVGTKTHRWGSATSPVLYKNLLIVNASVESNSIVALDKMTGKEVWRATGIDRAWNTPLLTTVPSKEPELVVNVQDRMLAFNPDTGKELWNAEGIHRYVCPSAVAHDGVIYAIGGGHTALAVAPAAAATSPRSIPSGGSRKARTSPRRFTTTAESIGPAKKGASFTARTPKRASSSTHSGSIPRPT